MVFLFFSSFHILGKYFINCVSTKSLSENQLDKLWLVVKSLSNCIPKKECYLKKGDVVKLGRIAFRVKNVRIDGKELPATDKEVFQDKFVDVKESKIAPTAYFTLKKA